MVNIKINNIKIEADENKTILEVAQENGIEIPQITKVLDPNYSCGLCIVNVVGKEGLVDASKTKIESGMKIFTDSRTVRTARKLALELILSDHYADCIAPCNLSCPLNIDIQNILSYIANRMYKQAISLLKQELPIPLIVSRICNAFCEDKCRRSHLDKPVEIKKLISFISDYSYKNKITGIIKKKAEKEKKVAIVGAGVSGLICGYYLSSEGYKIDIFDSLPEPGGLIRYAIPEFKLPKEIINYELEILFKNGMNFIPSTKIGKDISLKEISKNYDAVYIATGLQKLENIEIKNYKKSKFIFSGMDFLKNYHLGKKFKFIKSVIIYGDGDIALTCARIIKKMDLDVSLFFNCELDEFKSGEKEIKLAKSEGINFFPKYRVIEVKKEKGKLKKVVFITKSDKKDKTYEKRADTFILALEQKQDLSLLKEFKEKKLRLNADGSIKINNKTLYSGIENIFIGGEFRFGKNQTATKAIADGKRAAHYISKFLQNKRLIEDNKEFYSFTEKSLSTVNPILYTYYTKITSQNPENTKPSKKEKEVQSYLSNKNFTEEEAVKEASLCLECGCKIVSNCPLKNYAEDYNVTKDNYTGERNIYPIDNRDPFIIFDANKCIKCGNCVEVCNNILGVGVLGFTGKGYNLTVTSEFGKSLSQTECLSCGNCIEVCPTSALFEKNINWVINTQPDNEEILNCGLCGLGCEIKTKSQDGKIMMIKPSKNDFNKNYLCFEGKFGWQVFETESRIKYPMIRVDKTNDWQEKKPIWKEEKNLSKIAKEIKNRLKEADKKAIYIDPTISIEEVLLLKEIAAKIGAELSSFYMEKTVMDKFYNTIYTEKKYSDLEKASVIVSIGDIPIVLKSLFREMQLYHGTKLVVITQEKSSYNKFADILLDSNPINITLEKIIEYNNLDCDCRNMDCDCESEEILPVDLPENTMFVYNKDKVSEQTMANILRLSYQICSEYKEGSGIFEISDFINTKGFIRMKIPKYSLQISDFILLYGAMPNSEQLKWLEKSKFAISVDTHIDGENIADIFIPRPDYLSMDGIALATGSKIIKFKNVKREKYFENILTLFKNAGLLDKEKSKPQYWNKKALELVKNLPKPISYDENKLAEIIESIDEVKEKVARYYPVYYFEINKLKKLTK